MHDQKKRPEKKGKGGAKGEEKKKPFSEVIKGMRRNMAGVLMTSSIMTAKPREVQSERIHHSELKKREDEDETVTLLPIEDDVNFYKKRNTFSPEEIEEIERKTIHLGFDLILEPTELKGGLLAKSEDGREFEVCMEPSSVDEGEIVNFDIKPGLMLKVGYNEDDVTFYPKRDVSPEDIEEIKRQAAELGFDLILEPNSDKYLTLYDPPPTDGEISFNVKSDLSGTDKDEPVILDDVLDTVYSEPSDESKDKKSKD